jgi:hypothetical protein
VRGQKPSGHLRGLVVRVPDEVERAGLHEAQVLDNLPHGVGHAVRALASRAGGKVIDRAFESDVRGLPPERRDELLAQRLLWVHGVPSAGHAGEAQSARRRGAGTERFGRRSLRCA